MNAVSPVGRLDLLCCCAGSQLVSAGGVQDGKATRARDETPEQVRTFLEAAAGYRLHALFVLAVTTGLRGGELLGLHWRDVDLDTVTLQIRSDLQRTDGGLVIDTPKTDGGRRQVALSVAAATPLRQHRARQLEERLALGGEWDDRDLVMCTHLGRPIEASNLLQREYYPLVKWAGLPQVRFQNVRHTAATLLLERGVHPKVAADWLGHSTTLLTLDT